MPDIVDTLRSRLPQDTLSLDEPPSTDALGPSRGSDAPDAVAPLAVVLPSTTEQVVTVVQAANDNATPIVPYGGGTGLMGGARSIQRGIVLDLKRMNRIREITPEWVCVEAGAVLANVKGALAPHGRMLGHDPWTVGIATVGGAISTNGLGFLGGKYGSMGQQVLALEVVLADGTVLRTKPMRPHSTGVDLNNLFIAAEGTLGIITAAALRTYPLPESEVRIGFRFETFEAGFEALLEMQRIGLLPAVLDYGERTPPSKGGWWEAQQPTLYLGFLGVREEVDEFWSERHVPAESFAQHRASSWPGAGRCFDYLHVALPMTEVLSFRAEATVIARQHGVDVVETGLWVHPGLFSMILVTSGDDATQRVSETVDACLRLVIQHGGSIEYCHGVGIRLEHLMREEHGTGLDIMRVLKLALDPKGILNPEKLAT
jgi:FAD/FMN-containing dehydrogenase